MKHINLPASTQLYTGDKSRATSTEITQKIIEIERLCFDKPWNSVSFTADSIYIVEDYGYVLGTQLSTGECELYRIAVLPEYRGQGLAYDLMQRFLAKCNSVIFLEVASKNIHAVKLYEKCGFVEIARRRNYYRDDDGIVMRLDL